MKISRLNALINITTKSLQERASTQWLMTCHTEIMPCLDTSVRSYQWWRGKTSMRLQHGWWPWTARSSNFLGILHDFVNLGLTAWLNEWRQTGIELYPTECTFQHYIPYVDLPQISSPGSFITHYCHALAFVSARLSCFPLGVKKMFTCYTRSLKSTRADNLYREM